MLLDGPELVLKKYRVNSKKFNLPFIRADYFEEIIDMSLEFVNTGQTKLRKRRQFNYGSPD